MTHMQTLQWEEEHVGAALVYPTHPVAMACMVMDRFANLEDATSKSETAMYCHALVDDFLPGSGCAVMAGLDVLKLAKAGNLQGAHALAERYWQNVETNFPARQELNAAGRSQGEKLKARLESRLQVWETDKDTPSLYRIQLEAIA